MVTTIDDVSGAAVIVAGVWAPLPTHAAARAAYPALAAAGVARTGLVTRPPSSATSMPGSRRSPSRCRGCSPSTAPACPSSKASGRWSPPRLLGHIGQAGRFTSASAFASYAGVAPVEVASAQRVRHRLPRGGNRQLNLALHVFALTQCACAPARGGPTYDRKIGQGKPHNAGLR
jgi:hypothetical protein